MGRDSQRKIDKSSGGTGSGSERAGISRLSRQLRTIAPALSEVSRLGELLDRIVTAGDAFFVARTRDGTALCVTLFSGDEREKYYAGSSDELEGLMDGLKEAYESAP